MLGTEVAQAPVAQSQHAEILALRQVAAVAEHQLHVFARHVGGDRPCQLRQRVAGRGHGNQAHVTDGQALEDAGRGRHPATEADVAAAIHHQLRHGAHGFDAQAQGDGGKLRLERLQNAHQHAGGEHHVDHHRHFRLQSAGQRLGARAHAIDLQGHGARIGQQGLARVRQGGLALAAVEQHHIQLFFQVGDGVADHRLRAVQLARRMGEAARVDDGDKHAQLVERRLARFSHGNSLSKNSMLTIDIYTVSSMVDPNYAVCKGCDVAHPLIHFHRSNS